MKKRDFIILLLIILIDQIVKLFVVNINFDVIPGFLSFTYSENIGVAFSFGKTAPTLMGLIHIALILGITIFMIKYNKRIMRKLPFIMMLAGGLGNLIDRIFRGYVIDFINLKLFNFPVFNIADIFVVLGCIILIIDVIKYKDILKDKNEKNEDENNSNEIVDKK